VTEYIALGVIAVLFLWGVSIYNGLVALRQRMKQAYADIDVQLKQRHDLIPNLVETVRGYAKHENETLTAVIQARGSAVNAATPQQAAQAEKGLAGALGRLMMLQEAYPDLKANQNFQQLQSELSDIEHKVAATRRFFNNAVSEYNSAIQMFPAALIAGWLGFKSSEFFDVGEEQRQVLDKAPKVQFG
jgi:LemA protein